MKHISQYFYSKVFPEYIRRTPALIIGKGPTFEKLKDIDYSNYFSITINETSSYIKSDISFFIDIECVPSEVVRDTTRTIFTPYYMHLSHRPMNENVLISRPNYYTFDLARPRGDDLWANTHEWVRESYKFEAELPLLAISNTFEAVFHMLCLYGFKEIYSVGIDGGVEYHELFKRSEKPESFNPNIKQFETIGKMRERFGVKYERL